MRGKTILLASLCAIATPVAAQPQSNAPDRASGAETLTPPIASLAPEPDRIEAARELLDILMPPAQRQAMMAAMIEPMITSLEVGMMQSPELESTFAETPGAQALFMEFMATQRTRSLELAAANLPGMMEAMARAYARRFTVREMRQIGGFFETETGQTYMREANTIMADTDIAAWQRQAMAQSMQHLQTDIPEFMTRLSALQGGETAAPLRGVTSSNLDAMRGETQASEAETDE